MNSISTSKKGSLLMWSRRIAFCTIHPLRLRLFLRYRCYTFLQRQMVSQFYHLPAVQNSQHTPGDSLRSFSNYRMAWTSPLLILIDQDPRERSPSWKICGSSVNIKSLWFGRSFAYGEAFAFLLSSLCRVNRRR